MLNCLLIFNIWWSVVCQNWEGLKGELQLKNFDHTSSWAFRPVLKQHSLLSKNVLVIKPLIDPIHLPK